MAVVTHENNARWADGIARCSCGWASSAITSNTQKAWRQHVTRGTK